MQSVSHLEWRHTQISNAMMQNAKDSCYLGDFMKNIYKVIFL